MTAFVLLVLLALPCRAGEWADSVAAALEGSISRLSFAAPDLKLPGLAQSDSPAPGRQLAGMDLAAASREISAAGERLSQLSSAEHFLNLPVTDGSGFNSKVLLQSGLDSVVDSLGSYLPAISRSLTLLLAANRELTAAFQLLTPAEKEQLRSLVAGFEFWRDEWPDYPVRRMVELAGRVDLARLASAGGLLAQCVAQIRETGVTDTGSLRAPLTFATPWGDVVVGTSGSDHYGARVMLIVDPGGDDTYQIPSGYWPAVSVIVDFGGDDIYGAPSASLGGALCGASWLEDISGDDRYRAGPISLGCGALGVGVLVDREGDDTYESTSLTQGAAFYGYGALIDLNGGDCYRAEFGAQGACFAPGEAILADLAGNDRYFAGGRYRDYRSAGATKSFAQGCAAGIRPLAFGGRAALYDRKGTDFLEISYLGQGAGYWGGFGLLVSDGGDDHYVAGRYAQGCGLHFAAGALVDLNGNDSYTLEGVGQGAGEDRAWGVMLEGSGDDTYHSARMARGAGGTGGVGLLLELGGDDTYPSAGQVTGGAGSRTWELPGMGLMFDMRGRDNYGDGYADGQITDNGVWGARLDLPSDN
ncbi:hypothetical protein ACFL4X_01950 [Gemmatimonadota bacterium]